VLHGTFLPGRVTARDDAIVMHARPRAKPPNTYQVLRLSFKELQVNTLVSSECTWSDQADKKSPATVKVTAAPFFLSLSFTCSVPCPVSAGVQLELLTLYTIRHSVSSENSLFTP
jgi:hypothetical protein